MSELQRAISLAEIDRHAVRRRIEATPEEERALARRLGVEALSGLKAEIVAVKRRGAIFVTGSFEAQIRQVCVVTLDPFTTILYGEIDEEFAESDDGGEPAELDIDIETPEPLVGDVLDAGELVVQCLALEVDPHPRAPGADLASLDAPEPDAADPAHPFAALGKLQGKS